jgi:hypothetical protein
MGINKQDESIDYSKIQNIQIFWDILWIKKITIWADLVLSVELKTWNTEPVHFESLVKMLKSHNIKLVFKNKFLIIWTPGTVLNSDEVKAKVAELLAG